MSEGTLLCSLCSDEAVWFYSAGEHWSSCTCACLLSKRACLQPILCCSVIPRCFLFFFFMLQPLWQPGRSWKASLIQRCLWWTESVHPRMQSTCSTVQSGCCSEKKRKKSSLPLSPEHSWMPILSCCNTGEFNSYPDNVVNQLEVLVPWGYSH